MKRKPKEKVILFLITLLFVPTAFFLILGKEKPAEYLANVIFILFLALVFGKIIKYVFSTDD